MAHESSTTIITHFAFAIITHIAFVIISQFLLSIIYCGRPEMSSKLVVTAWMDKRRQSGLWCNVRQCWEED
jgi:hypothetical protein